MYNSKEIRKQFIDFFESKKHKAVPSAPVIPIDDPTLLFINAGMNQFKDIFFGKKKPEFLRVVNSQKCIRAGGKHNDLDEVGKDGYHHTFFEMLGNWSFGDYYKKEAIIWAWELLTDVWKLPKDKLFATVHHSDEEAYHLWKEETDIDHTHIEYHGDEDNFWEMGNTGPCGPCSEIHIDRGESNCNLKHIEDHKCRVNGDCHRYIELWNLVFIQYVREEDSSLTHLENKYVDTGAGFERICQVLQDKDSNYHTDLFIPLIRKIEEMSKVKYHKDERGTSHRVIADHIRSLSFAISDGEMPSNEGRGYVLRRILRSAAHHGRLLNLKEPFLYELVDTLVEILGDHYSELKDKLIHTKLIIKVEEKRFNLTLDKGIERFEEIVANLKVNKLGKIIPGKEAFTLYDTFGFPVELTRIMAEAAGYIVDDAGFKFEMEKQRTRAKEAGNFEVKSSDLEKLNLQNLDETKFIGYECSSNTAKLVNSFVDDEGKVIIVLDRTPFYAESGGQVADIGRIYNEDFEVMINDVQKEHNVIFHFGELRTGTITEGKVFAEVDIENRKRIARNHTATHLLHKALREILGEHVHQKGSLVHPDHLRFDFTHFQQATPRQIKFIEKMVNLKIRENIAVQIESKAIEQAKKDGAVALFGEKYGSEVRVVSVTDFSKELCGGIHINYTGEIGFFKIISESSIAAGVRRIEAITGDKVESYFGLLQDEIDELTRLLKVPKKDIADKIQKLLTENKELQKEIDKIKMNFASSGIDEMILKAKTIGDIKVLVARVSLDNPGKMKELGDRIREKIGVGVAILLAEIDNKVSILTIVTKDLTKKIQAGKIVSKVASIVGGKGGGRPDMAMAGGKDVEKIDEAVIEAFKIVEEFLNENN